MLETYLSRLNKAFADVEPSPDAPSVPLFHLTFGDKTWD
jgi:hypothetical protein